ncbi:hypothetical protein C8024_09785 [Sphingopyxis sp. BSNA05]|nr:hypothetical protein [Sphingopyxis sp. BSNA05]
MALKSLPRRLAKKYLWSRRMRATESLRPSPSASPIYVFIKSWNRPLHLWASLDSFYRNTKSPCRFVLIDNASDDPVVDQIIASFSRRGMFHAVHKMPENIPENQEMIYAQHRADMGDYMVLADGDVTIDDGQPDWLSRMLNVMQVRPTLGLLGTSIDLSDFISPVQARQIAPGMPEDVLMALIKAKSPERAQPDAHGMDIINPYKPAGRLLLARTETLDKTGALIGNNKLCEAVKMQAMISASRQK